MKTKTMVIVAKNDKEWRFGFEDNRFYVEDNFIIVRNSKNESELILSIDLFAYSYMEEV